LGDGLVSASHLVRRTTRAGEPEASMAPAVITEIVTRLRDAPGEARLTSGPLSDEEEARLDVVALEDVEHLPRRARMGSGVEGEGDRAARAVAWQAAAEGEGMRAPRVHRPQRGSGEERRRRHDARSRASLPSPRTRPTISSAACTRR